MATLRTLKFHYGQLTMQYDIQHWVLRREEDAEPDMVSAIISLFKHCLPNMTRSEIEDALTGSNSCCLVAVRRACDVVLQQKRAASLQGRSGCGWQSARKSAWVDPRGTSTEACALALCRRSRSVHV